MKKLTQRKVDALSLPDQLAAYCAHDSNHNPETGGLLYGAQGRLWNDWQAAIFDWRNSLPLK